MKPGGVCVPPVVAFDVTTSDDADVMGSEPRPNTDQTEANSNVTADRVTIAEAAERLGLSTDAVRMRVRRGTLPSVEHEGRRWVVLLRFRSDTDTMRPNDDQTLTEQASEHEPSRSDNPELIDQLRSEVSYLRQILDAEIEARRRADHLVAGMIDERRTLMGQITELQAGVSEHEAEHRPNGDRTEAKSANASQDAQDGPGRIAPPQMANETLREAYTEPVLAQVQLATDWRRWFRWLMES